MLSAILVPAILATLTHSLVLDRELPPVDANTRKCLDGLQACEDDFNDKSTASDTNTLSACVTALQGLYGTACVLPKPGNLNGTVLLKLTEVPSLRSCREKCNQHNRYQHRCAAWSYGVLQGESKATCYLRSTKGQTPNPPKTHEKMEHGELIVPTNTNPERV